MQQTLLATARAARARAYAPYSQFAVGAALAAADKAIFTGCNLENSSYGLTVCAERVALGNAYQAGYRRFDRLAVVADCSPPPRPCGACLQVIQELAGDIEVIAGNLEGEVARKRLSELLPEPFCGAPAPPAAVRDPGTAAVEIWRLPPSLHPIGRVRSSFSEPGSIPKNYKELTAEIHLDPLYEEGLYRIEEEPRILVVGYLHRAEGFTLKSERRGRGGEVYGVFACRTYRRPNRIAITEVELLKKRGAVLTVRGLDLIDGTPILDLKTVYRG